MKKFIAKMKELFWKWKENFHAFRKHPIQYTKDYFQNFKELSAKEKAIKILWAAAFVYATVYVFWLVVALIVGWVLACALFSGGGVEYQRVQQAQWMVDEYGGKESDYL